MKNKWSRLLQCISGYKIQSILSPVFVSAEVCIECVIPFITAKLINNIETQNDITVITGYGRTLIILAVFSLIFGALAGHFCAIAASGFAKNLRHDLFYKVQSFSFSNIDKFSSASLVTRLTTDVSNMQNAYMMIIRIAIRSPLMLIFSTVMTFSISGKLTAVLSIAIPFLIVGLTVMFKNVMPLFKVIFKKYDVLNSSIQENVGGIRAVKSFVRENHETEKFNCASDELYNYFLKAEKLAALADPFGQTAVYIIVLIICYVSSKMIVISGGSALSIGDFSAVLTYTIQILMSLMMLTMTFVSITMSAASANRITEVLNEESTVRNPENPVNKVQNGNIDFENVCFSYSRDSKNNTLNNVNLHIKAGETVGIIGPTGSSKTTLVQLISRLYDVTDGSVKVGDTDVRDYDLEVLRNAVSVVLQKNVLFSGTVKENLRWGNKNASDNEIKEACKMAQADEFIEKMPDGYDTFIERGGANVSGGQKQRLCIARAILKKPEILILDDSTSAVDTKTDALIRKAFKENIPDTTKIIIAQRISSVQDADKIIVLSGGTVSGIGTHEELMKNNEIYREVYESQIKAGDFDD